jgi:hypothetical protein
LPAAFEESYWTQEMGVTGADSMAHQVQLACRRLRDVDQAQRVLLFINVSAIHQPNLLFSPGAVEDSLETQADALAYVDSCLPPLVESLRRRGSTFCIVCSDHGTTYGEEGRLGHRCAHPVVWNVPYAEFLLPSSEGSPS